MPFRLWETQIEQKSQQEKETQLQIRDRGNPSDRFGVNRVQCEKAGGDERKKAIAEKAFGKNEEKQDDGDVQNQIHQMKPEGEPTKDFVTDEIGKTHQRPIIVAYALSALEGPDGAVEDLSDISEAVDIGVFENLVVIVVDEAVSERVDVRQRGQQDQYEEDDCIAVVSRLPAPATEHKIMVAKGMGGI